MRKPRGYWLRSAQELAICYTENDAHTNGYIYVKRNGITVLLHVWIWEQLNGPVPAGHMIDHVNGIRWDCRLDNLRCIPDPMNRRNVGMYSNNKSSITGVYFENAKQSWVAKWHDPATGTIKRKKFSINKHGEQAKQLAINYREDVLRDLIKNHGYTNRHGKHKQIT